jgi:GNAT superfamily N-acetyltransferase
VVTPNLLVMALHVVEIGVDDTYDLRSRVLRQGTASDAVEFDGDLLETTFHLGVRDQHGVPVAISTWMERAYPDRPADRGYQLRGMATSPEYRNTGMGTALLTAGTAVCRSRDAVVLWARARDTALEFYRHHGFEVAGMGYVDLTTGLAHHDVIRPL